jgi:DNA-binding response OmpR family regulator
MEIGDATEIPPIVLIVDNDDEARRLYAKRLQASGFWVATAADPDVAMNTATELKPNIIVAGITLDGRTDGLRFIRAVSEHSDTRDTPLLVLSGGPAHGLPRGAHEHAAAVLVKPVAPDDLMREIRRVLAASRGLRERSTRLTTKARTLRERSDVLLQKHAPLEARPDDRRRNCPECGGSLEWLERGSIGGVEYDYYRWCARACGLYCYDRTAGQFQKLA